MTGRARSKASRDFFVSGGTLPLDSNSYIERSADLELFAALKAGKFSYVLNSRQMGKSSLSVRTMGKLSTAGIRTVFLDLTQMGGQNVNPEQWYAGIALEIGRLLNLRKEMLGYFKDHADLGPMQRLFGAIRSVVLETYSEPLVIFIDEIDATRNLNFDTDEFFAGIRECFNRRVRDEAYKRVTFCLIGVAVPSDLIRNPATTPFNVGERIMLQDFTAEELRAFASALGSNGEFLVRRIHYWTGGQPFLTQSLCEAVVEEGIETETGVDDLVERNFFGPKARDTNINLADVANRALHDHAADYDPDRFRSNLLSAYDRIRSGKPFKDDESNRVAVVLKLSGLVTPAGPRLVVRNRIYEHVFDRTWIQESMPGQELIRQKQSFRRGIFRATSLAAAIIAVISLLGIAAWNSRQAALQAKSDLDYQLYVADMTSMRLFEESGDIARMAEVLARNEHSPHRNFEWGFWMARLHDSREEYTLDYSAPGKREEGILSRDESQICILDRLLDRATVVDRETKQVRYSQKIEERTVIPTRLGFVAVNASQARPIVQDLRTGRTLCRIGPENAVVGRVATAAGSDIVAALYRVGGTEWGHLGMWDICSGRQIAKVATPPGGLGESALAIAPDGKRLSFTLFDKRGEQCVVWDLTTNQEVDRFDGVSRQAWGFSHSGRFLFVNDHVLASVSVRDVANRRFHPVSDLINEDAPVSIMSSPSEKQFVSVTANGRARVTDVSSAQMVGAHHNVWTVSSTASDDAILAGGTSVRVLPLAHTAGARQLDKGVRITRDGDDLVIYHANDKRVARYSDPDLKRIGLFEYPKDSYSLTYNSRWFLSGQEEKVFLGSAQDPGLKVKTPPRIVNLSGGSRPDYVVVIPPSRQVMIGLSAKSGQELWRVEPPSGVAGVWMTPDSSTILATLDDGRLFITDSATGQRKQVIPAHRIQVTNLIFTQGGKRFFTGGGDGRIVLWDMATLRKVREFHGNASQSFTSADVSPDGRRVATCSLTGAWQLWDAQTGTQLMEVKASRLPMRGIAFTRDGKKILTSSTDYRVLVWSTLDKDPTVRIPIPPKLKSQVERLDGLP